MRDIHKSLGLAIVAFVGIAFHGLAMANSGNPDEPSPVQVMVERKGDMWHATFRFPEQARLWAFHRSALRRADQLPWRPDSWQVQTSGVELIREGMFDAFAVPDGTVPAEVRITFLPASDDLLADYDPALIFSNGAVALYAGHFTAFPTDSRAHLAKLQRPEGYPNRIGLADANRTLIFGGQTVQQVDDAGERYVIFGDVTSVEGEQVTTILDPALPEWLSGQLGAFSETIFSSYAQRLGDHETGKPTVLASWRGATPGVTSLGGSVSPDMISMQLEGEGLLISDPDALAGAQRFIAHEAAHLWFGQVSAYEDRKDMWITEGGAEMMAELSMAASKPDPEHYLAGILDSWTDKCATHLENGPIWGAVERQKFDAFYACGGLFAAVVDKAGKAKGKGFFDFAASLLDEHRGGTMNAEDWLTAASDFGVRNEQISVMRRLLAQPTDTVVEDLAILRQ